MAFDEKSQNVPTVENTGEKSEAKADVGGGKNAELQAEIAAAEKEAERVEGELIDLALEGEPEDSEKTKALAAQASEIRGKLQDLEGEMEKINDEIAVLETEKTPDASSTEIKTTQIGGEPRETKNPEKVNPIVAKFMDEMPTAEKIRDTNLSTGLTTKARYDKAFTDKVNEYAKSVGMGEELEDGGRSFSTAEILDLAKHFEHEILPTEKEKKRMDMLNAREHFDKASKQITFDKRRVDKLGKEGEGVIGKMMENYLDARADYIQLEPPSNEKTNELNYSGTLDNIRRDVANLSDTATRDRILKKLEQATNNGKK